MQNPLPQMNVTLSVDAMSRRDGPHIRVQLTAAAGSALPNKIERRASAALDFIAALAIGLTLAMLALAYFDILWS